MDFSHTPRVPFRRALSRYPVGIFLVCAFAVSGCDRNGNPLAATLPGSLVLVEGNGQSAPVSNVVPIGPKVRVSTVSGTPLSGITVRWEGEIGVASVTPATSVTNAQGEATTAWTYGDEAGAQQLTATVEGLTPVVFTGTATGS